MRSGDSNKNETDIRILITITHLLLTLLRKNHHRNTYPLHPQTWRKYLASPEPQPTKVKIRFREPIYYYNEEKNCFIYNQAGQGPVLDKVHHKEKIILAPESHESRKRHSFFKDRKNKQVESEIEGKCIAEAKLERDKKRGEMIEQRIFCHLNTRQREEYAQGKLKLHDLPALRPLLFDIEVDLDLQNMVHPDEDADDHEVTEVIMNEPIDEELNKEFFEQFRSDAGQNVVVYADDGHVNDPNDELNRFDIRGSQCSSYDMNMPSLSSSCSTELDLEALHLRPAYEDYSLDAFNVRASCDDDYSTLRVHQYNEELTLEAFNIVLGNQDTRDTLNKLDQVQTIKPEVMGDQHEGYKQYVDDEEYKPIVVAHKVVKTMELKLDYFVDVLDTRTGQLRCEMGPKLIEICDYEDVVKGPECLY